MFQTDPLFQVDRDEGSASRDEVLRKISTDYDRRGASVLAAPRFHPNGVDGLVARVAREWWEAGLPPPQEQRGTQPSRSAPNLLDLCCGTGAFSIYPAKMGYRVWGVDLSPKSIEAAEFQANLNGVASSCHFFVEDALDFLREENSSKSPTVPVKFDVISICGSLYYLDLGQVIPLLVNRLADGGTLLCLETNGGNQILSLYRRWRNRRHRHRDEQTLKGLLRASDYAPLGGQLTQCRLEFLDCVTLLTPLVFQVLGRDRARAERFHTWARRLDQQLLKRTLLRGLAFKIGFVGRKPNANTQATL